MSYPKILVRTRCAVGIIDFINYIRKEYVMYARKEKGQGILYLLGTIGVIVGVLLVMAFVRVSRGHIKVVTKKGAVTNRTLDPGWYFITPLFEGTVDYKTMVQSYETSDNPKESEADFTDYPVNAQTADGQQISIKYTVIFHIPSSGVPYLAQNVGRMEEVVENIVKAHSRNSTRLMAQEFEAEGLYGGEIIRIYQQQVRDELTISFAEYGIALDEFLVRKIEFDEDYIRIIENQQIEQEKIKTAQFQAQQAVFEGERNVTLAKADSEKRVVLAQGDAQAKIELAIGEAESIRIIAEADAWSIELRGRALALYPNIVTLEFIQQLEGVSWGILPGDSLNYFLNLPQ